MEVGFCAVKKRVAQGFQRAWFSAHFTSPGGSQLAVGSLSSETFSAIPYYTIKA